MAQRCSDDPLKYADKEKNSKTSDRPSYDGISSRLKNLKKDEFNRLKGVTYLDHAGTTLYAESQLKSIFKDLSNNVYGNPHSRNSSSRLSSDLVDYVRARVAQHFNTTLDEYNVVFTSGATGACKLLAEVFEWSSGSDGGHFVYLEDNHTSVLGMRELALEFGSSMYCLPVDNCLEFLPEEDMSQSNFDWNCDDDLRIPFPTTHTLFAYPAQSNFCGRKYPLSWIQAIQKGALQKTIPFLKRSSLMRWSVLLDAAAYVGTSHLNLEQWKPDFVSISFHKMFGLPTGLGALLVHHSASDLLQGRYFGGGTVLVSHAHQRFHVFQPTLAERFEAGTVSFLDILAVRHGLDFLQQQIAGFGDCGMLTISRQTFHLARYVYHRLTSCRHGNDTKVAVLYCDTDYEDVSTQGAIVNFNLLRSDGQHVGFAEVEKVASVYDIHFRTGCMCNPGACQRYLRLTLEELKHHFQAGHVCGDDVDLIDGRPTGSIRVSFGYMSTWDDADRLVRMIELCFVDRRSAAAAAATTGSTAVAIDVAGQSIERSSSRSCSSSIVSTSIKKQLAPLEKPLKYEIGHKLGAARRAWWKRNNTSYKFAGACRCHVFGQQTCSESHVKSISLFPVKSCGSFETTFWKVGPRGFLYDREWIIVTNGGVSLTQKREPKMCLIKPEIDLERGFLWLHSDATSPVRIALDVDAQSTDVMCETANVCQTKVCGDRVKGIDCGNEVADWLSAVIGREGCRLLRQPPDCNRTQKQQKGGTKSLASTELSLANEAQYLLLNFSSASSIAKIIKDRTESSNGNYVDSLYVDDNCGVDKLLARFRGNLVVDGPAPFSEDKWKCLAIGDHQFKVQGLCNRCQMICIDQDSGERSKEPLVTLAATQGRKTSFGIYLYRNDEETDDVIISVGDPVTVITQVT